MKKHLARRARYQIGIAVTAGQLLTLPGCLMMFNGSEQHVGLSSNPAGAKVTVNDGASYTTPTTISLPRKTDHKLVFEKEGYQTAAESLSSSLNGFFLLDVLLWGPFALFDFMNGSAYKLSSENVDVTLVPKPAMLNTTPTSTATPATSATDSSTLTVPPTSVPIPQPSPVPNSQGSR
ncbi:MAG TPA: PEGA domain-containing protein [Candidatus Binataceae bacterium]|nr:PEGA domain-containing protein [Candidatus Binataceae bacterium]